MPAGGCWAIGEHRPIGALSRPLVGRTWEMAMPSTRSLDARHRRPRRGGDRGGTTGHRQEPAGARGRRDGAARGVEVFTAFCESHASDIPFHVVARLLRAATGVDGLDAEAARARCGPELPDADPEDLLLFDDLLGIADPEVALPEIDPDARRRRLTALINAASLARKSPAIYVIEDAHWIDEVSESMLADFFTVIPQTPSLVLITYRPEYHGVLTRVLGRRPSPLRR